MKPLKKLGIFLIAAILATGCAVFKDSPQTAKMFVQYSVAKLAEQSSDSERVRRMTNAKTVAIGVKALVKDEAATIPALNAVVLSQVAKLNLSPADQILATGLVNAVTEYLQKKVGEGLLRPEDRLVVADVMDWVIEAATLSGAT